MKLTPNERDILYLAIREPILALRAKMAEVGYIQEVDDKLFELERTIWAKICADLPDCLVGETATKPNKED